MSERLRAGKRTAGGKVRPANDHRGTRCAALLALAMPIGCATGGANLAAVPDSLKAELRTIAVVAEEVPQEIVIWKPSAKQGAKDGAWAAMGVATYLTMGLWPLAFFGAGAVAVPALGAGIGAIVGAAKSPSDEESAPFDAALQEMVASAALPLVIRDGIVEELSETNRVTRILALEADSDLAADYASLARCGVGGVLEIEVASLRIDGPWGSDPTGAPPMTVVARIIRTVDGSVAYSRNFEVAGAPDTRVGLTMTGSSHAEQEPLRGALIDASRKLAREIATAIFSPAGAPSDEPTAMSGDACRAQAAL